MRVLNISSGPHVRHLSMMERFSQGVSSRLARNALLAAVPMGLPELSAYSLAATFQQTVSEAGESEPSPSSNHVVGRAHAVDRSGGTRRINLQLSLKRMARRREEEITFRSQKTAGMMR